MSTKQNGVLYCRGMCLLLIITILVVANPAHARMFEDPGHRAINTVLPVSQGIEQITYESSPTYVVKRGDTLNEIARRYQISVQQIQDANGIANPNLIKAGQVLSIPAVGAASNHIAAVHVVKQGDTLWEIARDHGIGVDQLAQYNAIENPNRLRIGQDIVIPGRSEKPSATRTTQAVVASRQGSVTFLWPVQGVITSTFGRRWGDFHYGLDIAADTGTPVKAARGGTVLYSGWRGTYGKTVIIEHNSTYRTLYAHNSQLLVKEGEVVRPGQVIAKVGSTGRSTGPHIHFEVQKNGKALDPLRFLQ
ncbi:murein DD-endopeptidase MepM/ murein hydrolase activator NlpD [Desulfitispora alkaliphila]|uniref:peptidoglycan DD-metalloendopeptidase family protein n=1 Tax=Desulfitispora alkaliphila TaxID=622674 RepID=UPI003D218A40